MKNQKGFSLVELLIVVVIIGIIASIAVPNLMASRRAANEGAAISALRSYHTAQMTYQNTDGAGSFAGNLSGTNAFPVLSNAKMLDETFAGNSSGQVVKSGYLLTGYSTPKSSTASSSLIGSAEPLSKSGVSQTGSRIFLIGTSGAMYFDYMNSSTGMTWDNSGAPITISNGTALGN